MLTSVVLRYLLPVAGNNECTHIMCIIAARREAGSFVEGALDVKKLPTVFVYPEGTPGFMRYQGMGMTWAGQVF